MVSDHQRLTFTVRHGNEMLAHPVYALVDAYASEMPRVEALRFAKEIRDVAEVNGVALNGGLSALHDRFGVEIDGVALRSRQGKPTTSETA